MSKFIETKYSTLDVCKVSFISCITFTGGVWEFETVIDGAVISHHYDDKEDAEEDREKIVEAITKVARGCD